MPDLTLLVTLSLLFLSPKASNRTCFSLEVHFGPSLLLPFWRRVFIDSKQEEP